MFTYSKSSRTHVELPHLAKEDFVTAYAQQRPFREGGNRLEKDFSQGKIIVHNYGHGGAGVSLAPGSAIEAVRLAEPHLQKKSVKIAVIGSGVVGLFNCKELLKHYPELKITVYAERIPVFGVKDNEKLTTSQVAPGFWLPYHYGSNNPALHARLSTLSLNEYSKLAEEKRFSTVLKPVQMMDITDEEYSQDYFKVLTEELRPSYHQHQITINQKAKVKCRSFATIKIDMQPFIRILIDELKSQGVRFVSKKINKQNLYQLKEEIIFNCSGLGSRELFNDTQMRGIKGHLVEFRNKDPAKYDFLMRANVERQMVTYYMHQSRIILGLTREDVDNCKIDPAKVQLLIDSHQKVLEKFGLAVGTPKL